MSEKCQEWTHAPQQTTRSLDYRIGHSEQLVRHSEAERALVVFKLIINSYLVGACTGRSAGFSPLRIRPIRRKRG